MNKETFKRKQFFEGLMQKDFLNKEKRFTAKSDYYKMNLRYFREDLYSFPTMTDDEREDRQDKLFDLCGHFATTAKERNHEVIFNFWPNYFNQFMTPKLFDRVPNEWFTNEFGFCFACKHFKGEKKGHHKLFNSISKRKIISLFGRCNKIKSMRLNKEQAAMFKYNNHVMPNFRCKGWEPSNFYVQLLKRRLYNVLTAEGSTYTMREFNKEQDKINIYTFLSGNEIYY